MKNQESGRVQTASENHDDESQILTDQDLTNEGDITALDENLGARSNSLDTLEDDPADFLRGDIDVTEQMARASKAMQAVASRKRPDERTE